MKILVQKFGGTSVSTPERRQQVIDKILGAQKAGYHPVVVVSALGRAGEPYATDTLLSFAKQESSTINKRELDMIMACGEIVAGVIVVGALKNIGLDAVLLNGQQAGIITTMKHGDAQILRIKPDNILKHVKDGQVVVVAGFQGVSEQGEITTLGRGGSDTSASALGAAIGAAAVEIYTDVNGIMTADPRIVSSARTIPYSSYEEVYQLAVHGAKVIHQRAVEIAMDYNIPLKIKCTFSDEEGTTISNDLNGTIERLKGQKVIGIANLGDYGMLQLKIGSAGGLEKAETLLSQMVAAGIDADFINVSHQEIEFVAAGSAIDAITALSEEIGIQTGKKVSNCAKISLIGRVSNNIPDLVGRFIEVLRQEKISALQSFTGPYGISGIVAKDDMVPAIQALHQNLFGDTEKMLKKAVGGTN